MFSGRKTNGKITSTSGMKHYCRMVSNIYFKQADAKSRLNCQVKKTIGFSS